VSVAGRCSTTRTGDSSSLPPPQHPQNNTAPPIAAPVVPTDPGDAPGSYADLLDRIRAGYALTDVQHAAVDRELALYRSQPDLLDRTFRRGARYLHYIVGEIEKRGMPMELALLPVVESAFNPPSRIREAGPRGSGSSCHAPAATTASIRTGGSMSAVTSSSRPRPR
jgi:hypothetical protein